MDESLEPRPRGDLAEVLRLSWPASLSMFSATVLQFIDGFMVSRHGPASLSAQFMGGLFAFVPTAFAMGTLPVINAYVSQNLGAGRPERCGQYAWAGMMLVWVYSAAMVSLIFLAPMIFALLPHAEDVTGLEVMYFRYLIAALGMFLTSRVLEQFFFGVHRPVIVLVTSLTAIVFNIGANYVLIFGKLGFPELGLEGAAIGTVASMGLRLAILMGVFLSSPIHRRFATRNFRKVKRSECLELVRVGLPAGLQFCNWMLTWSIFVGVLVRKFGTEHLAANTIVHRYTALAFMPAVGIGIATTALVGRCIGAGRPDLARRRVHAAVAVAVGYTALCGLAYFLFRRPLVEFFVSVPGAENLSPEQLRAQIEPIVTIGGRIMVCAAVFLLFDGMGIVLVGALRGGGDTLWPMLVQVIMSWTILIGGGAMMVNVAPQLTSLGPWIAATVYVCALGVVMGWRFESGAWRKIDLLGRAPVAGEPLPAEPLPGVPPPVPVPADPKAEDRTDADPGGR